MLQDCKTLEEVWDAVREVNKRHFSKNDLSPIFGNGKTFKPKIMLVFINPTRANVSSDRNWKGPRFPFVGTKQIWRTFHRAGMFDDRLMKEIEDSKWTVEFTEKVLDFLKSESFYFTNIVKWTGHDAALPDSEKIGLFLPILEKEIEIVQPEYIMTFGLIPFENLTGEKIKLSEEYDKMMKSKNLSIYDTKINSFHAKIIPCYFPVGRGNPKRAVDILRLIKRLING